MPRRAPRLLNAQELFEYAVKRLAARAHSKGELREKLRRKAEHEEDVETVLRRLEEFKYLDDRKFAESYAAARLEDQQLGARRVVRDLRARRVAPSLAEQTVGRVYGNVDEEALIEDYLRRKYHSADSFQDQKGLASAYGRLLRAGFTPGLIIRVLRKFTRQPDLLDGFEPPETPPEE
ncbi:MAG TPA: regulatory protein RecX [Bryobacteraceae bacterium]|nr:regulatory protein RecX [Bryobacteraceae bacterium]